MSILSIITAALPIILQIVGFFIKRSNIDDKIKKNYFEWIAITGNNINSVKLMKYGKASVKWFDENPFVETK